MRLDGAASTVPICGSSTFHRGRASRSSSSGGQRTPKAVPLCGEMTLRQPRASYSSSSRPSAASRVRDPLKRATAPVHSGDPSTPAASRPPVGMTWDGYVIGSGVGRSLRDRVARRLAEWAAPAAAELPPAATGPDCRCGVPAAPSGLAERVPLRVAAAGSDASTPDAGGDARIHNRSERDAPGAGLPLMAVRRHRPCRCR